MEKHLSTEKSTSESGQ